MALRLKEHNLVKLLALLILLTPGVAYANMVWPALYLETRLFSWWAITVGLVIEYLFIRRLFNLAPKRAAIATFTANAASAVAGVIFIPVSGIVWELFPGSLYMWAFGWGTFNPLTWGGTVFLACLINAFIESVIYRKVFKVSLVIKSKAFLWLVVANAFSVGVALASMWVVPVRA
jgi:hypothetical protein